MTLNLLDAFYTSTAIINKFYDQVMVHERFQMREIVSVVGISSEREHNILYQQLKVKKLPML